MSRDRKGFTRLIGVLWEATYVYPDLRVGQLINNAVATWNAHGDGRPKFMISDTRVPDLFYIEDDLLADIVDVYVHPEHDKEWSDAS